MANIGLKIKQVYELKNIPIADLAQTLAVTHAAVYMMFQKEDVSTKILKKLNQNYGIPYDYFFNEQVKIDKAQILNVGKDSFHNDVRGSNNFFSLNQNDTRAEVEHLHQMLAVKNEMIEMQKAIITKFLGEVKPL